MAHDGWEEPLPLDRHHFTAESMQSSRRLHQNACTSLQVDRAINTHLQHPPWVLVCVDTPQQALKHTSKESQICM